MATFTIERTLDVPRTLVWEKLADFGNVHIFHPMVEKSALIGGRQCGPGSKRSCEFYGGKGRVEEEITGWQEGKSLTVTLRDGTMPMKNGTFHFKLEDVGTGSTRVLMQVDFEMKYGLLGKIMGPLMMKPMMKKMLGDVLSGLEAHCRTGKRIGHRGVVLNS